LTVEIDKLFFSRYFGNGQQHFYFTSTDLAIKIQFSLFLIAILIIV